MTRIAFIGVGTMGLPIARNLLAAGHKLVLCDVDPTRAAVLGVEVARTSREAVAEQEGLDAATFYELVTASTLRIRPRPTMVRSSRST